MRAVIQRANGACVRVAGREVGAFAGAGLVVLLGVTHSDGAAEVAKMVDKIANLRILEGEKSVLAEGAPVLVVSQFTLYGDTRKGRRPGWSAAAAGDVAQPLYEAVIAGLREAGVAVESGEFGAMMEVELVNSGPFTVLVEV